MSIGVSKIFDKFLSGLINLLFFESCNLCSLIYFQTFLIISDLERVFSLTIFLFNERFNVFFLRAGKLNNCFCCCLIVCLSVPLMAQLRFFLPVHELLGLPGPLGWMRLLRVHGFRSSSPKSERLLHAKYAVLYWSSGMPKMAETMTTE